MGTDLWKTYIFVKAVFLEGKQQDGYDAKLFVAFCSWLLASGHVPANKQSTNLCDMYLMLYVQSWTPDDGRKDRPKHVVTFNKLEKLRILLVLL